MYLNIMDSFGIDLSFEIFSPTIEEINDTTHDFVVSCIFSFHFNDNIGGGLGLHSFKDNKNLCLNEERCIYFAFD